MFRFCTLKGHGWGRATPVARHARSAQKIARLESRAPSKELIPFTRTRT